MGTPTTKLSPSNRRNGPLTLVVTPPLSRLSATVPSCVSRRAIVWARHSPTCAAFSGAIEGQNNS